MPDPSGLHLSQNSQQTQKQTQRLMMLPQMQQALTLLQMPVMELAAAVETEMEQNPLLDNTEAESAPNAESETEDENPAESLVEKEVRFDDENFAVLKLLDEEFRDHFSQDEITVRPRTNDESKRASFLESLIQREETLGEHLIKQAHESFEEERELQMAEVLIGSLDDAGYLTSPLQEIALLHNLNVTDLERILREIQTFDPIGVGSTCLQQSLLLQLSAQHKQDSPAYQIIQNYWEDLLHHRIPAIAKGLGASTGEISRLIHKDIAPLHFHPASSYSSETVQHITPDVAILLDDDTSELIVAVNDEPLPAFRFNRRYLRMLEDPTLSEETKEFIRQKLGSARWLSKTIEQRKDTIQRIAETLIKWQADFFQSPDGQLKPLTMKSVAEELGLHESTIARAVANKHVATPRGLLPLRSFFTNAYVNEQGEDISSTTVRNALEQLIRKENKSKPLSDDALSRLLKLQGISCARRTVAKYRGELQMGNALQRRSYE